MDLGFLFDLQNNRRKIQISRDSTRSFTSCSRMLLYLNKNLELYKSHSILRPIPCQKLRLSHVNIFLRHYGGQLKTAAE